MKEKQKESVNLTVEVKNDKLVLSNGIGNRWEFPENYSRRVAIASLVYGALLGREEKVSCYADKYRISIEVEVLDD